MTKSKDVKPTPKPTKVAAVIALVSRPEGASLAELMEATGWQAHSVRGALSGAVRKTLGRPVSSQVSNGLRRYRASAS